jgi:hypothetical protein
MDSHLFVAGLRANYPLNWIQRCERMASKDLFRPRRIDWKANIVVWVVTVAVFLGTLVGGGLILFLFSQRDLIREALRNPEKKRMERRTVARVELLSTDAPFINEIARCKLAVPENAGQVMAHPTVPFAFVPRKCSLSWSFRFQTWSPLSLECMTSISASSTNASRRSFPPNMRSAATTFSQKGQYA